MGQPSPRQDPYLIGGEPGQDWEGVKCAELGKEKISEATYSHRKKRLTLKTLEQRQINQVPGGNGRVGAKRDGTVEAEGEGRSPY